MSSQQIDPVPIPVPGVVSVGVRPATGGGGTGPRGAVAPLALGGGEKFFIVDALSYAYQAHYAIGNLETPTGTPVGVVYGFTQLIERILREKPSHLAVVFDAPGAVLRSERFPDYKIQRPAMPEALGAQIPLVKELLAAYRIPFLELSGYEADDLIGTLARHASGHRLPTYLISKDKDLEQLLDEYVLIFNPKDGECLDPAKLLERKGLRPDQVVDYLALVGDSSDNVPGVEGIGPKTALKILAAVKCLDEAFEAEIPGLSPSLREKLRAGRQSAELSRELVTLNTSCPMPECYDLERYQVRPADRDALVSLFQRFRFLRLMEKYSTRAVHPPTPAPAPAPPAKARKTGQTELDFGDSPTSAAPAAPVAPAPVPPEAPQERLPSNYRLVLTEEDLRALSEKLASAKLFAMDTETSGLDPFRDSMVGLSFAVFDADPAVAEPVEAKATARQVGVEAFYLPLRAPSPLELEPARVFEALRGPLEDPAIAKVGQNAKFDLLFYRKAGVRVRAIRFDTMLAAYLLNPEFRAYNLDILALDYLDYRKIPIESVLGAGKDQMAMERAPLEKIRDYACEDAEITLRLFLILSARLRESNLETLLDHVEIPLVEVLAEMEWAGITIDPEHLSAMGGSIRGSLEGLTREIHSLAGEEFNVASPVQLAGVLYGRLNLPRGPRGKSGVASTAADVLAEIRDRHPIVPKILEHRELTKLLGTYVEALPLLRSDDGRIHTSFNQTVAATGRLSSSNPNLQNIPIKTGLGREIRKAFRAGDPDHLLLSADYSQVELRILAHLSGDQVLLAAFQGDEDIHRSVAARLYGVEPEAVTPSMRRLAKAVNFGIVYGQTPFGLSQELGISVEEAAEIIRNYFDRHAGVRAFIDETIAYARQEGSVRTLLNRRRPMRDINSRNHRLRAIAERTAVNSMVQGSAADLIKVAMNNIYTDLNERQSRARLLLQIHDELVLEVPRDDLAVEEARVRAEMVEAMSLRVPLVVNTHASETWYEAQE